MTRKFDFMAETQHSLLQIDNLVKQYGAVTVVDGISFRLEAGSVRAIVGENGAGKSTLMKMLTGVTDVTSGVISISGKPASPKSPKDAAQLGVSMVHQELQLVPELSLIDNLMLAMPPNTKHLRRGSKGEVEFVTQQLARVGLNVSPTEKAKNLSAAQAQLLSIAKALVLDTQILILDEPTAALPPDEVDMVLEVVEKLKGDGHGILYISHHLSEIMRLADGITVLRDGKQVGNFVRGELTEEQLVGLMVDRPVNLYHSQLHEPSGDVVLSAQELGGEKVSDLSFDLHAGEILGFAGLIGSGTHDAGMLLAGAAKKTHGQLFLGAEQITFKTPADAVVAGILLVPEERKTQSIVAHLSVKDNIHIGHESRYSHWGKLNLKTMGEVANQSVEKFDIRLHSVDQPIGTLSGGNQQKAILARCIQANPKVLILADPTRGIDIAAKDDIHQLIVYLAEKGMAVILISSEMDEVIALSHRVAVFAEGHMAGILKDNEVNAERVMGLASPKRKEDI